MYAAASDHLPVVEYLVERGADIQAKNDVNIEIKLRTGHT